MWAVLLQDTHIWGVVSHNPLMLFFVATRGHKSLDKKDAKKRQKAEQKATKKSACILLKIPFKIGMKKSALLLYNNAKIRQAA